MSRACRRCIGWGRGGPGWGPRTSAAGWYTPQPAARGSVRLTQLPDRVQHWCVLPTLSDPAYRQSSARRLWRAVKLLTASILMCSSCTQEKPSSASRLVVLAHGAQEVLGAGALEGAPPALAAPVAVHQHVVQVQHQCLHVPARRSRFSLDQRRRCSHAS